MRKMGAAHPQGEEPGMVDAGGGPGMVFFTIECS